MFFKEVVKPNLQFAMESDPCNGLFILPDPDLDPYLDMDYCTM